MASGCPGDIADLFDAFDATEYECRSLVAGITEELGDARPSPSSWTIAECLDHLAVTNRVYVQAMETAASVALASGKMRRGPALPGMFGAWFVRSLEPPVRLWSRFKAPAQIRPRPAPRLSDAAMLFYASQDEAREFLRRYKDIDLTAVHFANPFFRGLRLRLATGLHVLLAHERRHFWQARTIREALERSGR